MAFRYDINQRLYKFVAANTSETLDYTPANGEKILIERAGGSSSTTPDTTVCVVWDPGGGEQEILVSTYRDTLHEGIDKEFTGDGSKVLQICLTNDLSESSHMGGFVQAVKI